MSISRTERSALTCTSRATSPCHGSRGGRRRTPGPLRPSSVVTGCTLVRELPYWSVGSARLHFWLPSPMRRPTSRCPSRSASTSTSVPKKQLVVTVHRAVPPLPAGTGVEDLQLAGGAGAGAVREEGHRAGQRHDPVPAFGGRRALLAPQLPAGTRVGGDHLQPVVVAPVRQIGAVAQRRGEHLGGPVRAGRDPRPRAERLELQLGMAVPGQVEDRRGGHGRERDHRPDRDPQRPPPQAAGSRRRRRGHARHPLRYAPPVAPPARPLRPEARHGRPRPRPGRDTAARPRRPAPVRVPPSPSASPRRGPGPCRRVRPRVPPSPVPPGHRRCGACRPVRPARRRAAGSGRRRPGGWRLVPVPAGDPRGRGSAAGAPVRSGAAAGRSARPRRPAAPAAPAPSARRPARRGASGPPAGSGTSRRPGTGRRAVRGSARRR